MLLTACFGRRQLDYVQEAVDQGLQVLEYQLLNVFVRWVW